MAIPILTESNLLNNYIRMVKCGRKRTSLVKGIKEDISVRKKIN
jgi:hypothetical protein